MAIAFAALTVFQLTKDQPVQAATGIFAEFPFQGRLTNSDGTVVANASYDAVFQLYTVSTGGTAVWSESHTGGSQLSTTDGIFNTMLGSITSLTGIDFNQDSYYLGITVGADAEMTPRIRLGAAPYSFNTDKLDGISAENFLQLPGQPGGQTAFGGTAASENLVLRSTSDVTKGNVIIADDGGNVGIGTATAPDFKLEVAGNLGSDTDNTNDLGSAALRWRDLYLGPASLHFATTVAETTTARNWQLNVDTSTGPKQGDLRIQEGSNSYFGVTTAGNVVLGSAALATSATDGFLYTPSMAGVPTGVPTNYTGRVPLIYNTASNTLYLYNSGWQAVAGGGGGGISGSGVAGQVVVWNGTSSVLGDAEYLYDTTQNRLSIGSTPSTDTAAVLSIPNNKFISARNGTNSGNVALIGLNSSDFIQFPTNNGASNQTIFDMFNPSADNNTYLYNSSGFKNNVNVEGFLGVYNSNAHATPIATSGHIRLPNDASISSKAAGAGDVSLIKLNTSDYIQLGPTQGVDTVINTISTASTPSFAIMNPGSGLVNTLLEGTLSVWNVNNFAVAPASTGVIRLPNDGSINAKKVGAGDATLITLNTSDQIQLGPTSGVDTYIATTSSSGTTNFLYQNPGTGLANTSVEGALNVYNQDGMPANIALTGAIRLGNNASLMARNVGNSADISLISLDTNNQIAFGYTSTGVTAFNLFGGATETLLINNTWPGQVANTSVEGALNVYNQDGMPANIALTGAIRLGNNADLMARNSTNTVDVSLIKLASSDQIAFGYTSTGKVAFDLFGGATETLVVNNTAGAQVANMSLEGALNVYNQDGMPANIANTGAIRIGNNAALMARNVGNTADISLISLDTNNQIAFGYTSTGVTAFNLLGGVDETFLFNNTDAVGKANLSVEGALTAYGSNAMTGAATTGNIRLPNNASISARNVGDTADISLIKLNTSNLVEFGTGISLSGSLIPSVDDTYDLGSSSFRWRDLYLGPTSLHLNTTVAETTTARDWKLNVDETNGATDGDLRIQEGSNSYFGVTTAGNIVLGSAALATTATNGFLYTPSMAGTPTGVPTAYTGRVPFTYDSTTNVLYAYNGGAWQQLTSMSGGAIALTEVAAPSATANQGKLYVQAITGGNSIFYKDSNGVATDLVNDKLGTSEKLRTIRGNVNADGTIAGGSGFTINKIGTGSYVINFTTSFSQIPTVIASAETPYFVRGPGATIGTAGIVTTSDSAQTTPIDAIFSFIAVGTP